MSEDLSDAYANGAYIADAASYPPRWSAQAEAFRASLGERAILDQAYGGGARQTYDLFEPEGAAHGTVIFVHGGYWRAFDKSVWSYFAAGPLARGWRVVMAGYTLAPTARISQISEEIRALVFTISAKFKGPLHLTGHSAGGHLVSRVADLADRVVSISGLHDLRPLLHTDINADLNLDAKEADAESPILQRRPNCPVVAWVGGDERPAFIEQSKWLGEAWGADVVIEPGKHHFDVIDSLCDADGSLTNAVLGQSAR